MFKGIQDWMDEKKEEGREEGRAEGREEGREEGHDEFADMIRYLMHNGRNEDVIRATEDKAYRKQLFAEYTSLALAN